MQRQGMWHAWCLQHQWQLEAVTIHLHSTDPPIDIQEANVHFAFPDGLLSYDCNTCGGYCCRGYGYDLQTTLDLREHLSRHPQMSLFLKPDGFNNFAVKNCAPGCFHLTDSNLCGIQVSDGYSAKPETCRLFPFNDIRRCGSYLIVLPHPYLCPLTLVPHGASSGLSSHSHLTAQMRQHGIHRSVPVIDGGHSDIAATVALEQQIATATLSGTGHGGYIDFARYQTDLAAHHGVSPPLPERLSEQTTQLMLKVLGLDASVSQQVAEDIARTLIACTPAIRAWHIFPDNASHSGPVPTVPLFRLPQLLLALELVLRIAASAGMRRITYQTVSAVWREHRALLCMLARVDDEVVWKDGGEVELTCPGGTDAHIRYLHVARALLPSIQHRSHQPLGSLLLAHAPSRQAARALFLRHTAARLCDASAMPAERHRWRRMSARSIASRTALRWIGPSVLVKAVRSRVAGMASGAVERARPMKDNTP